MNPMGLILLAAGAFSMCGAWFDWDLFMESRKARLFVAILGRNGARVFYGILGLTIALAGLLVFLGIVQGSR